LLQNLKKFEFNSRMKNPRILLRWDLIQKRIAWKSIKCNNHILAVIHAQDGEEEDKSFFIEPNYTKYLVVTKFIIENIFISTSLLRVANKIITKECFTR
jgi:hypothetical protein